mmetsp:Transcript_64930/g.155094  ORF Transcript_64930/g.155094 Transcript_64930/m.155094 type:complete len:711 (+) Transcript_64930:54-2186(+)
MGCCQASNGASAAAVAQPVSKTSPPGPSATTNDEKSARTPSEGKRNSDASNTAAGQTTPADATHKIIMRKYKMSMSSEDKTGEGTSSICRRGVNIETGEEVAIKVYKTGKDHGQKAQDVILQKFKRQISVLKELQEPLKAPADSTLWHETLGSAKPSSLFMQLVDYSKTTTGEPGRDVEDGEVYVVTELAQYSLKDYLALQRDQNKPLARDSVRRVTRAIILVVAGLHSKGLVHIDLKPENLMMFNGKLKLIDVDGCVRIGTSVSIQDSTISFSPCYCAPEWARFLINDYESKITITPNLDVWSVGMTICELVTLDPVLKPMYANFLRNAHSHREAGFLFMEWLSNIKKVALPKSILKFDPELVDLLKEWLLVCDHKSRKTLAESLSHTFLQSSKKSSTAQGGASTSAAIGATKSEKFETEKILEGVPPPPRVERFRVEDASTKPLHKGTLFKLNSNSSPQDDKNWLQRDMWIAPNGSLCYFSIKDGKRLVLVDGPRLSRATFAAFEGGAKPHAFQIQVPNEDDDKVETIILASTTVPDRDTWMSRLRNAIRFDIPSMHFGGELAQDLQAFVLAVRNRRMKIDAQVADQFEPVFKEILWKVKTEGDRMKEEDWFEREMWIAKNGSLVYWSKKEERELVYYTSQDLVRCSIRPLKDTQSCKPFTFQIILPPADGVEFAPGEFAAVTKQAYDKWLEEFRKVADMRIGTPKHS